METKQTGFATTAVAQFLAGSGGRLTRIVAGVAIIAVGLAVVGGPPGLILAAVGLIPIAAGVFDFCLLSPLFGGPFSGSAIRACARS